jgi:hypothetical protein
VKPYKTVIYSFFVGGTFALIAQAILVVWQALFTDTCMSFFSGGATLVTLGVIGCVLGGLACYQYLEEWATFGALLPFSGFAMAVGMKGIGPWTKENATLGRVIKDCGWFVLWFNVLFAVICIAIGFIFGKIGFEPLFTVEKTTTNMIFPYAFLVGGLLAAFFQIVYLAIKSVKPNVTHLTILIIAWMCGCIFTPLGVSGALSNFSGEGFAAMITVGGYNMYNVGFDLAEGNIATAMTHLGSFCLAVFGLFITALGTFGIYNSRFGRKPLAQVHLEKAQAAVDELTK